MFSGEHVKLKRRGNFILRMRTIMDRATTPWGLCGELVSLQNWWNKIINEMKGDVGMSNQQK